MREGLNVPFQITFLLSNGSNVSTLRKCAVKLVGDLKKQQQAFPNCFTKWKMTYPSCKEDVWQEKEQLIYKCAQRAETINGGMLRVHCARRSTHEDEHCATPHDNHVPPSSSLRPPVSIRLLRSCFTSKAWSYIVYPIATTQVHRWGETERNDHAVYARLLSWCLQLELNLPTNTARKEKCKQTHAFITLADAVLSTLSKRGSKRR